MPTVAQVTGDIRNVILLEASHEHLYENAHSTPWKETTHMSCKWAMNRQIIQQNSSQQ